MIRQSVIGLAVKIMRSFYGFERILSQNRIPLLPIALWAWCATARALRQVAAHHKGIQLFPARLPVIALAASGDGRYGPLIEPARRLIIFLDLEEHGPHAAAGEMAEMRQQQIARQPPSAMAGRDGDRQYFGLVRRHPRHREADCLVSNPEAVNQRVALGQHALEFASA